MCFGCLNGYIYICNRMCRLYVYMIYVFSNYNAYSTNFGEHVMQICCEKLINGKNYQLNNRQHVNTLEHETINNKQCSLE